MASHARPMEGALAGWVMLGATLVVLVAAGRVLARTAAREPPSHDATAVVPATATQPGANDGHPAAGLVRCRACAVANEPVAMYCWDCISSLD